MIIPPVLLLLVKNGEQLQDPTAVAAVALGPALLAKTIGGLVANVVSKVIFVHLVFLAQNAKINLLKLPPSVPVKNLTRLLTIKKTLMLNRVNLMLKF